MNFGRIQTVHDSPAQLRLKAKLKARSHLPTICQALPPSSRAKVLSRRVGLSASSTQRIAGTLRTELAVHVVAAPSSRQVQRNQRPKPGGGETDAPPSNAAFGERCATERGVRQGWGPYLFLGRKEIPPKKELVDSDRLIFLPGGSLGTTLTAFLRRMLGTRYLASDPADRMAFAKQYLLAPHAGPFYLEANVSRLEKTPKGGLWFSDPNWPKDSSLRIKDPQR